MLTKLSQNHMNQISALRIQAENGQIGYHIIYSTLASLLQSDYSYTSSDPTVLWLRGATEANAGRGSLSELIRVYSNTQAQLRYGENISNSLMQQASNEVAKNLLKNLFGEGDNGVADYAIIPDINKIAADDATAVGKIIFNRDLGDTSAEKQANSAWSGTLLFTQLTSDQSFRLMSKGEDGLKVDSLNDWRDVLYAYVSYEAGLKAARSEFISEDLKQEKTDIDILGNTFYGYVTGEKTFIDYLSTLATGSDSQGLLSAFNLINSVGVNKFLDMLMGVVLGDSIIGTTNDDNFFANAKEFFKSSVLSLETQTLNQLTLDNLIDLAENDANIRAALNALSMVSIETSPAVKEKFDLYNPIIGYGDITHEWIEDRAKALQYFYEYNKNAGLYDHPEFNFIDIATGIELKNPSILGVSKPSKHDYIFGSEDNNIDIQGGDGNDHIYGGGGDDEIYGGEGDDYLEGGHGSDELHGGNDNDKLVGMDGDNYLYGDDGNDLLLG
ncbi:calcium-binding protein [Acinetobacter baumannii]|uniref:calcium-binding protein n=1 Tax=Acinetobacter baumannii TaxID=470 RepID=UPI0022B4709D|nr:calcium-binding protein [Acinetobacter baumannii]